MPKLIDRTGHVYGRLTVIGRDESAGPATNGKRTKWLCKCSCGAPKIATGHDLAAGHTRSCGCVRKEELADRARTHGMTRTPTYRSWQAAKERCHNPNASNYSAYGGSGIEMCDRWRNSFECFLEDMGERPSGMTLDRLDQCKGYEPGNVQWATTEEQSINRGTTKLHRWRGGWMTTRQIADAETIPFNSLRKIIRQHRTIQSAVAHVRERMGRSGIQNIRGL